MPHFRHVCQQTTIGRDRTGPPVDVATSRGVEIFLWEETDSAAELDVSDGVPKLVDGAYRRSD